MDKVDSLSYPPHLLPTPDYKCIEGDLSAYYLIRHAKAGSNTDIWDRDTGTINIRKVCSPKENIYDLSTNLYGIFTIDNCQIELTEDGKSGFNQYCRCDQEIEEAPKHEKDFILNPDRKAFFLKIGHLRPIQIEYTNPKTRDRFEAVLKIEHSPMRWNFWHFSLRWEITHPENAKFTHGMKRKLASEARASIAHFCKKEADEKPQITNKMYLK